MLYIFYFYNFFKIVIHTSEHRIGIYIDTKDSMYIGFGKLNDIVTIDDTKSYLIIPKFIGKD